MKKPDTGLQLGPQSRRIDKGKKGIGHLRGEACLTRRGGRKGNGGGGGGWDRGAINGGKRLKTRGEKGRPFVSQQRNADNRRPRWRIGKKWVTDHALGGGRGAVERKAQEGGREQC